MIEVHLAYSKEQFFAGEPCIRVFGDDPKDLDVFIGVMCLDRRQDHLIFRKEDIWRLLQRLLKLRVDFKVTGG